MTCASCQFCTCHNACVLCSLYRPSGLGKNRLSGSAFEDGCVCDMPKHCPACSVCICENPATADEIAADAKHLPGVKSVRVRRHVDLPAQRLARFWELSKADKIIVYLDHEGVAGTAVHLTVTNPQVANPFSMDLPATWLNFLRKWHIATTDRAEELVSDYDPRRFVMNLEDIAIPYADMFLDVEQLSAGDPVGQGALQAASRVVVAALLADTHGACPSTLLFKFPVVQAVSVSLQQVAPVPVRGAPMMLTTAHCDLCVDPRRIVGTIRSELFAVPDSRPSAVAITPAQAASLLTNDLLDYAAAHEIPLWSLTIMGVLASLVRSGATEEPEMMLELFVLVLASVSSDSSGQAESAETGPMTVLRDLLHHTTTHVAATLRAQSHGEQGQADAAWALAISGATDLRDMWSDVLSQEDQPSVDADSDSTATSGDGSPRSSTRADDPPDEADTPEHWGAGPNTHLLAGALVRVMLARWELAALEGQASRPLYDLTPLRSRKAEIADDLRLRQARAHREQAVLGAAERLREHLRDLKPQLEHKHSKE